MAGFWDFLTFAAPHSTQAVDQLQDNRRLQSDLAAFQKSPDTFQIDPAGYNFPDTAMKANTHLEQLRKERQQQAALPMQNTLDSFRAQGFESDPSFSGQEWTKGMLDLEGVKRNTGNPVENSLISSFATNAQQMNDLQKLGLSPESARLALNKQNLPNLSEVNTMQKTAAETAAKQKSLEDFAYAQDLASSALGFIGKGDQPGDYLSAPEVRNMVSNDLKRFALTPEQRNSLNSLVDKGISDKWIETRTPTPKGTTLTQRNPYTGEVKDKVENTTVINTGDGAGKEKLPQLYTITKPDGRLVTVDASTPKGRARLDIALRNGEQTFKGTPTQRESSTEMNADGSTSTKSTNAPKKQESKPVAKPAEKPVERSTSKSGKPMIKVNGVWEYE